MFSTTTDTTRKQFDVDKQRRAVVKAIVGNSFCVLATSSSANQPHAAGVLYVAAAGKIYLSTSEDSIKVRNMRQNPRVAVCIPVRKFPLGPPYAVHFQGRARVRARQDPEILELVASERLDAITSHGELESPGACFVEITPARRIASYGVGLSLLEVIRDPLNAVRSVELRRPTAPAR